ncbi:MAG: hypothetical protein COA43_02480 [Robiginitomaculum sp.]|nr:MAG: hypothetical protein COA43_02480 [Robiginitomaculum sp.]
MQTKTLRIRARDCGLLILLVLVMVLPGLSGLPVIDRDEARYAQASVQMIETGDYIDIRFQDRARHKKPAGAYWLQALSVKAFSDVNNRDIWAHRIPSVIAAILAILATYLGGISLIGRQSALIGSALLATGIVFVFESHIAKTDALLCACAAVTLVTLGKLHLKSSRKLAIVFWIALGCAVMIKGPILPMLIGLCLLSLVIWERSVHWLKPLTYWLGPVLFLVIVLPWAILIWQKTNGAFFTNAIIGDLTPKLKGGHERHGGAPGYYVLTTWLAFWPACLFLLPGLSFAIRAGRAKNIEGGFHKNVAKSARFLLCWSVPFFIMLEIVPTKLPHYTLPIYPALTLMAGAGIMALSKVNLFPVSRRIGAFLFAIFSIALIVALLGAEAYYGDMPTWSFLVMAIVVVLVLFAAIRLWQGQSIPAFQAALCATLFMSIYTYQFTLPNLHAMNIGKRVQIALRAENITAKDVQIYSPQFTEPSLVYHLGTHILLGKAQERLSTLALNPHDIVILDKLNPKNEAYEPALKDYLKVQNQCLTPLTYVEGFNYAKGDYVNLEISRVNICE